MEDYEKLYKDALAKARVWKEKSGMPKDKQSILDDIFPELESEDEKIRKRIIDVFHGDVLDKEETNKAIAWLEKQYKQKYTQRDIDDAYLKGVTDTKRKVEKESEKDKKIRADIANFIFKSQENIKDRAKWIKYLGYTPTFVEDKQKPADNVGSKFKVGDWIVHHGTENIYQVVAVIDNKYKLKYGNKYQLKYGDNYTIQNCADVDKNVRLWDITKDAKDGDVLAFDNDIIVMFKDLYNATSFHSYCYVEQGAFSVNQDDMPGWWQAKDFHPATKEQRDILFVKMKEAGYKWDDIDKTPKNIEPFDKYEGLTNFERTLADICSGWIGVTLGWKEYIKDNANVLLKIAVEKLNSVQDDSFEQKLAWSKEDEEMINNIIDYIKPMPIFLISTTGKSGKEYTQEFIKQAITWLKSLKKRYSSTLLKLNIIRTVNQINNQMRQND